MAVALPDAPPDCRVLVSGSPLSAEKQAALVKVAVDLDVDLFGHCVLEFNDPGLRLVNGKDFACGTAVTVKLGFGAALRPVFDGEVVALEPLFRRDRPVSLRVVCEETLHRLALTSTTRALNDVDDRQIVTAIAREHGLSAEAPSGTAGHVLQPGVTDAVFLRRVAQKHGHHVRIEGTKLIVGPPPAGAQLTLGPGSGISKMKVKLNANSQVSEISAHGWDPAQKREIVGRTKAQGPAGQGSRDFGKGTLSLATREVAPVDPATADAMARGRMRRIAESFAVAHVEMLGDGRVLPGAEITVETMGPPLDGTWRVEHAEHQYGKNGYSVRFKAVHIAKPKPPRPAAPPPTSTPAPQPASQQPAPAPPQAIEAQRLEVQVLDAMGKPRPQFFYRLAQQGAPEQVGMTDAEGYIRTTLPAAGQWKLFFPDVDGEEGT